MTDRYNQLTINIAHGSSSVNDADQDRAFDAALAILNTLPEGVTVAEAHAEMLRQGDEGVSDAADFTGIAAIMFEASMAANIALTDGWADTGGASCEVVPA